MIPITLFYGKRDGDDIVDVVCEDVILKRIPHIGETIIHKNRVCKVVFVNHFTSNPDYVQIGAGHE